MPISIRFLLCLSVGMFLTGCRSSNPIHLDTSGPTMAEILAGNHLATDELDDSGLDETQLGIDARVVTFQTYEGYARDSQNEINQLFPLHDNPQISVYIHPHLATSGNYPIPGYTTAFSLYEKNEYALPGESISSHFNDDSQTSHAASNSN